MIWKSFNTSNLDTFLNHEGQIQYQLLIKACLKLMGFYCLETKMYRHNFLLSRYAAQSTGSFHAAASARPFVRQCHFYRSELGRLGVRRLWHIILCHRVSPTTSFPRRHRKWQFLEIFFKSSTRSCKKGRLNLRFSYLAFKLKFTLNICANI